MPLFSLSPKSLKTPKLTVCGIVFDVMNFTPENVRMVEYYRYLSKMNVWEMNNSWIFGTNEFYYYLLYKVIDDCLCIFLYDDKNEYMELYCMPMGDYTNLQKYKKVLKQAFDILYMVNGERAASKAVHLHNCECNMALFEFLHNDDYFKTVKVPAWKEYLNDLDKVVALAGSDYKYLRRELSYFERTYPDHVFRKYTPDDYEEAMKLRSLWKDQASLVYGADGINCNDIYGFTLENFEALHQEIFVVEIGGEIKGMVSYEELYDETAVCVFRISDHEVANLSKFLSYKIMQEAQAMGYKFMNDGGSPDEPLISFKQKYRGEEYDFFNVYRRKSGGH